MQYFGPMTAAKSVKADYPEFDICHLEGNKLSGEEFNADRFKGYLQNNPHVQKVHKHSFYHLAYFSSGAGEHIIDFETFPVRKGMIYFMRPGQVHKWSFKGEVDGYVVNLKTQAPVMIISFMLQLFVLATRETSQQVLVYSRTNYNSVLLKNFLELIEEHFKEIRLPKDYALMLYITSNHLNFICKEQIKMSAGEVIRNRVLLEAKRLLVNFELSVTSIAMELNFFDTSYFIKFLKKYTNLTPEQFRKQYYIKPQQEDLKS